MTPSAKRVKRSGRPVIGQLQCVSLSLRVLRRPPPRAIKSGLVLILQPSVCMMEYHDFHSSSLVVCRGSVPPMTLQVLCIRCVVPTYKSMRRLIISGKMCVFIKNTSVASRVSPKTKSRRMRARALACHKRKYSCCAPGMNVRMRVYFCECVYNISKTALPEHRHGPGARAEKPCAEITGEQRWRWRWG